MTIAFPVRRWAAAALTAVVAVVLTGCVLTAGKFTSALDIRTDGTFSYSYNGEIFLLGLSKLADMNPSGDMDAEFEPSLCYTDAEEPAERECTKDEIAEQKTAWEEQTKAAADRQKKEQEAMRTMLGGFDPADPKAAEDLAARLRKQAGWRSVVYKGDGLFVVDFALTGRTDHDFVFPTIERLPQTNAFVTLIRRADGSLRVDAPGFSAGPGGDPFRTMMRMAAMEGEDKDMPKLPELSGTFTLTTNGEILTNNTEDGPVAGTTGKVLTWQINQRTEQAPSALVRP
jgi:predicted nucleic acid-binding Zn ribbon protein